MESGDDTVLAAGKSHISEGDRVRIQRMKEIYLFSGEENKKLPQLENCYITIQPKNPQIAKPRMKKRNILIYMLPRKCVLLITALPKVNFCFAYTRYKL